MLTSRTSLRIAQVGLVAALYAAITVLLAPISYGPIQIRIAEALTVLPYIFPPAIWGLYVGCLVANIFGGLGPWDIFLGSFLTLLAAIGTYLLRRTQRPWLAPLPPVFINALGVSAYLQFLVTGFTPGIKTYFFFVLTIGVGETIACYLLGYPLLLFLMKSHFFEKSGS
ncbi:QueT transporter family protein [candidate division KSB1 bacterium]|nr:QueT transporter family protein [bacterium]RKY88786.1 MAG: QueT transporter family protein [candidate division KSB1 bacterium]